MQSSSCRLTLPPSLTFTAWCHFLSWMFRMCPSELHWQLWPWMAVLCITFFFFFCLPARVALIHNRNLSLFLFARLKNVSCYDFLLFNCWMKKHRMVLHAPVLERWDISSLLGHSLRIPPTSMSSLEVCSSWRMTRCGKYSAFKSNV